MAEATELLIDSGLIAFRHGVEHLRSEGKASQLIERAMSGEEVILAKAGKPLVKLVPIAPVPKRTLGAAAGTIQYSEGWDAPMTDEELNAFLKS